METEVYVCDILGPVLVDMVLQSGRGMCSSA